MIDYKSIIDSIYDGAPSLKNILLRHSEAVAKKAAEIVNRHPEWNIDRDFIYAAAMLHDIGIIRCNAPSIECHGTEPYIKHGVIGAEMITSLSQTIPRREDLARVCERHTGTGLPGLEPETLEEKIVCYADKFFSKTKLDREKTYEEARQSLLKFGEEGVKIFDAWHEEFD